MRYPSFSDNYRACVGRRRKRQGGKVTTRAGNRGGGRWGEGERVKACTGTKDHEKFLEIGLYGGEDARERGIEGGR